MMHPYTTPPQWLPPPADNLASSALVLIMLQSVLSYQTLQFCMSVYTICVSIRLVMCTRFMELFTVTDRELLDRELLDIGKGMPSMSSAEVLYSASVYSREPESASLPSGLRVRVRADAQARM